MRVLVAEDHPVYREGVVRALEQSERIDVIAQARDGTTAVAKLRALSPSVALFDVRLPGLGGVELFGALLETATATRVVFLSAYTDADTARRALGAGAAGYLSKDASGDDICQAVLRASEGATVISPSLQADLMANIGREARRLRRARDRPSTLTERELQVLTLAAEGRTGRQIGQALCLSHTTVKTAPTADLREVRRSGQSGGGRRGTAPRIARMRREVARPLEGRSARAIAAIRVGSLPVVFFGERLVDRTSLHERAFDLVLAGGTAYALVTVAASIRAPGRPPGGFRRYAVIDCLLLGALAATSGGPSSQVHYALVVLPLAAAVLGQELDTALAFLGSLGVWLIVVLVSPGGSDIASGYVLAQTLALAWPGGLALAMAFVLGAWRRRVTALVASRQELIAQAQRAEDDARQRLAYSLHDGPIQNLLVARLELDRIRRGDPGSMERAGAALDETVAQLRDAIFELYPHVLDELGLAAALRQLGEKKAREGAVRIRVDIDPHAVGTHDALVFSLAREMLGNALKHAKATEVRLDLRDRQGELALTIEDDGRGFDSTRWEVARREGHVGLAASAERVEAASGRMSIESTPGVGTRVRISLPTASRSAALPLDPQREADAQTTVRLRV